jgi:hypothetical protein
MALKAIEAQKLEKVGLTSFFVKNQQHYQELAQDAYDYTARTLESTGMRPRQDDVSEHLRAALEVDDPLTNYRDGNRCAAAYWVQYFTNLVLDRLWGNIKESVGHLGLPARIQNT